MKRLREFPSEEELIQLYTDPYRHDRWTDHIERVAWTRKRLFTFLEETLITHIVDPACGDGAVTRGVDEIGQINLALADLVSAPHVDMFGQLEHTMPMLARSEFYDTSLLVLTEIIEHVEDPASVLDIAHEHYGWLLLTTPIDEQKEIHDNPQHIWSWEVEDMAKLLRDAGWSEHSRDRLDTFWYDYQLWICKR